MVREKPKGGVCSKCGHKGLTFNDDGTGSCPSCSHNFVWDKSIKVKPKGGVCSKCSHKGLAFNDDGTGSCPSCGYSFIWDKSVKIKPKGGVCSKCNHKGLTFNDDGTGICPDCGNTFVWDKSRKETTPATPAEVPEEKEEKVEKKKEDVALYSAVSYHKANVIYKVKIENNMKSPVGEVHILPYISDEIFIIDSDKQSIPLIKSGESKTVTFKLRPKRECGNTEIRGRVTYYDYVKDDYAEKRIEPRLTQVVCPLMRVIEISEDDWQESTSSMIKIEETTEKIPISATTLFEIVTDVIKDMNMYMFPAQKTEDENMFRGVARFYCQGVKGLKYATQLEVIGGSMSKLFIKAWAENEESLLGFYVCLLDEIEKRTKIKEHIEDQMITKEKMEKKEKGQMEKKAPKTVIESGYSYLIYEEKPDKTFKLFDNFLRGEGADGIIITTSFPGKLTDRYGLEGTKIYWMTERTDYDHVLNPKRLDFEIARSINNFIMGREKSAILLAGIEFLILENGFDNVIKFIKKVMDAASTKGATIVVPINPRSIDEKELNMFKREFDKAG